MRRGISAGAGWLAFAGALWMWSISGGRPQAPALTSTDAQPTAVPAHAPRELKAIVLADPVDPSNPAPVRARMRVTLETLSDASAETEARPTEDIATSIQRAASRAGRKTWFSADWTADGKLDAADIAAFLTAYQRGQPSADLNHDGVVDARDYAEFMRQYRMAEAQPVSPRVG